MAARFDLRKRDGTLLGDIASVSFDKKVTRKLNRPTTVTFRVPSDDDLIWTLADDGLPYLCAGYRQLMVTLDGPGLYANTIVWSLEDEGEEDISYTRVTCFDPMILWRYRPARDFDGDFTDPTFLKDFKYGPAIMQELLLNSEFAGNGPPEDAEGPLFLDYQNGFFATGGVDLSGAPANYPMMIADIATLLTNSGELDLPITPVDAGATMGVLNYYNGNYGTNRTSTVHFDYATGDFNVMSLRRIEDMTTCANKIWRYLGPREDVQHWRANVTGDDPYLPGNTLGGSGIGGALPGRSSYAGGPLGDLIQQSRDALGVMMDVQIADDQGSEASVRPLQRRLWQMESLFRAGPRNLVYVTPVRDGQFGPGDFDVGDLITINVGNKARRAIYNMEQRIYGFDIDIDDDGVEALGEFMSSPDMDSI